MGLGRRDLSRWLAAAAPVLMRMGEYFDLAADLYGMPRPPRVTRDAAQQMLAPTMLSFMGESRRMRNARIKQELRVRLRYPTVLQGLVA